MRGIYLYNKKAKLYELIHEENELFAEIAIFLNKNSTYETNLGIKKNFKIDFNTTQDLYKYFWKQLKQKYEIRLSQTNLTKEKSLEVWDSKLFFLGENITLNIRVEEDTKLLGLYSLVRFLEISLNKNSPIEILFDSGKLPEQIHKLMFENEE